jgi:alpha-N-arabinofuranosidase
VNLDPSKTITIRAGMPGIAYTNVGGQILTSGRFNDVNSFDQPDKVKPAVFKGARKEGDELVVEMPPMSVVVLELN